MPLSYGHLQSTSIDYSFVGYSLGDPDADNAYPVYVERDGSHYAVCDHLWNDITATVMCKMNGMRHGRRTSVTATLAFASTGVECYHQTETVDMSKFDKPPFVMASASYCSDQVYEEEEVLPCARTQGAAVYCWRESWSVDFYNVQVLERKEVYFILRFNVRYVKYGQYYDADDTSLTKKQIFSVNRLNRMTKDFYAECWDIYAMEVTFVSFVLRDMNGFYLLEGIDDHCRDCYDVMFVKDEILVHRICPYDMSTFLTTLNGWMPHIKQRLA